MLEVLNLKIYKNMTLLTVLKYLNVKMWVGRLAFLDDAALNQTKHLGLNISACTLNVTNHYQFSSS